MIVLLIVSDNQTLPLILYQRKRGMNLFSHHFQSENAPIHIIPVWLIQPLKSQSDELLSRNSVGAFLRGIMIILNIANNGGWALVLWLYDVIRRHRR